MAYFPLFVDISEKEILVIGGGTIATRRVRTLIGFGCRVTVVAPETSDEIKAFAKEGKIRWLETEYEAKHLETGDPMFVLAAATGSVNERVASDCRQKGIPVNDASHRENCDFYFPGIVKEGDTVIGVTSGGKDHKLASALTEKIRQIAGAPGNS